ncbi:hypothetical protein ACP70R_020342 [Stipagrostis hirtigluma subsp. patula]
MKQAINEVARASSPATAATAGCVAQAPAITLPWWGGRKCITPPATANAEDVFGEMELIIALVLQSYGFTSCSMDKIRSMYDNLVAAAVVVQACQIRNTMSKKGVLAMVDDRVHHEMICTNAVILSLHRLCCLAVLFLFVGASVVAPA